MFFIGIGARLLLSDMLRCCTCHGPRTDPHNATAVGILLHAKATSAYTVIKKNMRGKKRRAESQKQAWWCLCSACYPVNELVFLSRGCENVDTVTSRVCIRHCREHGTLFPVERMWAPTSAGLPLPPQPCQQGSLVGQHSPVDVVSPPSNRSRIAVATPTRSGMPQVPMDTSSEPARARGGREPRMIGQAARSLCDALAAHAVGTQALAPARQAMNNIHSQKMAPVQVETPVGSLQREPSIEASLNSQASGMPADPDAPGIPVERLRQMESHQPGADGARPACRAERAAYAFNGELKGLLQRQLCNLLTQLFNMKSERNCSAEAITDVLVILSQSPLLAEDARTNMPLNFKAMLAALHQFGFPRSDLWKYDMCPCGKIYRCESKHDTHCSVCHKERTDLTVNYQSVDMFIQRLYQNQTVDTMLSNLKPSADVNMRDMVDGELFQDRASRQDPHERVLYTCLYFDPFQPFKDDARYSTTPFVLTAVNVPPQNRWDPAYSACLSLLPGSRSSTVKVSMQSMLQLIIDELEYASTVGIQVVRRSQDGAPAEHFVVKVELLGIFSDYRGLAHIVGSMKQAPARFACFKSWHQGTTIPGYKTIYQTHVKHLHEDDPLREELLDLFPDEATLPEPRRRMQLEVCTAQSLPIVDVSKSSHPHLFLHKHQLDQECIGQFFVGVPAPATSTVQGEEEEAVASGLAAIGGVRGTGGESSSGGNTPESGDEEAAVQVAQSTSGLTLEQVQLELQELQYFSQGIPAGVPEQCRLLHYKWVRSMNYDPMHVLSGVIGDTFLKVLRGARWENDRLKQIEHGLGRFSPSAKGPGELSAQGMARFSAALSCIAVGLKGEGGSRRLHRLLDPSKKPKTHEKLLLAGPIGLYALSCVKSELPPKIFETLQLLLQACSLLWVKVLPKRAVGSLQAIVLKAVCMVELHLPVSERDIKLHELFELAHSVAFLGPCFTYSMFPAESRWGELVRMLKNKRFPEASMLFGMMDKELLSFYKKHVVVEEVNEDKVWGEEQLLSLENVSIELEGELKGAAGVHVLDIEQCQELHVFYTREDEVYDELWSTFVAWFIPRMSSAQRQQYDITNGIAGGWDLSPAAMMHLRAEWSTWCPGIPLNESVKGLIIMWPKQVICYDKVRVEGVPFSVGDWFMARPNEANDDFTPIQGAVQGLPQFGVPQHFWCGKIKRIFSHSRYGGDKTPLTEDVLEVQWHVSLGVQHGGPYSVSYQAPLVLAAVHPSECPFFPARSVLPIKFCSMRALGLPLSCPACYVMIRRQWHCLGAVKLPVPWPAV